MQIVVKKIDKSAFDDAKSVRLDVFCDEQGYSPDVEFDEHDTFCDETEIVVAYDGEKPVGTARIIYNDEHYPCKIGRIAVLKDYRKYGVGRMLLDKLTEFAVEHNKSEIVVDAQVTAMGFYAKCGYVAFGEEHPDGHIMHRYMKKTL